MDVSHKTSQLVQSSSQDICPNTMDLRTMLSDDEGDNKNTDFHPILGDAALVAEVLLQEINQVRYRLGADGRRQSHLER